MRAEVPRSDSATSPARSRERGRPASRSRGSKSPAKSSSSLAHRRTQPFETTTRSGRRDGMRVRLKGISSARKRLADGRLVVYWYAWRCGPRLEGEPGSPAFVASYNAALASRQKPSTETLNALLDAYRDAEAFRALAPKTAKDYGRILSTIGRMFGDCPLKLLHDRRTRGDFLQWRDDIARTSPRTADYTFAVFARALSWASDRGLISLNPLERHGQSGKGPGPRAFGLMRTRRGCLQLRAHPWR